MSAKGLGRLLGRVISERERRSEVQITPRQILCVEGTTGVQQGLLHLSRHYTTLHGHTISGGEGRVGRSQAGEICRKSSVQVSFTARRSMGLPDRYRIFERRECLNKQRLRAKDSLPGCITSWYRN